MKKKRSLYECRRIPCTKKVFRIMKVTTFLLFVMFFQVSAGVFSQNRGLINLKAENESLKEILRLVENQSKYRFLYNSNNINVEQTKSIDCQGKSIDEVLDMLFNGTDIRYRSFERTYVLFSEERDRLSSAEDLLDFSQQQKIISGKITDSSGEPLPGVTVVVKGTTQGTVTNADGEFSLANIPEDGTLVFSFVGMQTQEISVVGKSTINISMEEEAIGVDEVVVVGYGIQRKVNLTGAVTQVSSKEIEDKAVSNMTQILQGSIPNLNITTPSGKPGEGGTMNIRGNTSLSSSGSPMVLIDGVPGNIDRINPSDVESVTVLKDASSAAIYGARAAFGVILVTTKSVKEGKPRIQYSNNYGWITHSVNTDFITSGYWNARVNDMAMTNSLGITTTGYSEEDYDELWSRVNDRTEHPDRPWVVVKPNSSGKDMFHYYGNFDWFNYLYSEWRTKNNHNVNITGASSDNRVRYMFSAMTNKEDGIIAINQDNYNRNNFRVKLDADVTEWLTISNNTSFFKSQYNWTGKADNFNRLTTTVTTNPMYFYFPAYVPVNPDGSLTGYTGKGPYQIGYGNHANWLYGKSKGIKDDSDLLSIFEAKAFVLKGLELTANYAYGQVLSEYQYRQVKVPYSLYPGETGIWKLADLNKDKLTDASSNTKRHALNLYANYDKTINKHHIKTTVGFNQEWQDYKIITGRGQDLLSENLNDLDLVTNNYEMSGGQESWALRGAFFRFNYDYEGKYLGEFSGRYDGTSRFPKAKRFAFFPSFSLGWRLSEEAFMDFLKPVVNNLKLRYSYGSLGNQLTSNYGYIENMSVGLSSYLLDGDRSTVTSVPSPISDSYTWEVATTNNVGMDISLLDFKLNVSSDFYIRDTKNMLMPGPTLPSVYGTNSPKENAASLRTKGYEISVEWKDKFSVANSPFSYNVKFILSDYTAQVTEFNNPTRDLTDYYAGKQLGEIWGYSYGGIFSSDDEAAAWASIVNQDRINKRRVQAPTADLQKLQAGDIKIWDLDGDGDINIGQNTVDDPGDRKVIGNSQPRYLFGINLGADWNGLDFSVSFQGIGRQHWYPNGENEMFWQVYSRPYSSFIPVDFMEKVWTKDNPNAYFPLMRAYLAQNSELSVANDMYLQDLAYCKLKSLVIGYSLPAQLLQKTGIIEHLRIYLSGENLFKVSKLDTDYIDPEGVFLDPTGRGYPLNKIFSVGVNVTL